jgi:hypothetical protein
MKNWPSIDTDFKGGWTTSVHLPLVKSNLKCVENAQTVSDIDNDTIRIQSVQIISSTDQSTKTRDIQAVGEGTKSLQYILHYDDLPAWMQIDPYIRHGYRRQLDSFSACFFSTFCVHNELMNILSHLLPSCFFLISLVPDYSTIGNCSIQVWRFHNFVIQMYATSTLFCLLLSVSGFLLQNSIRRANIVSFPYASNGPRQASPAR